MLPWPGPSIMNLDLIEVIMDLLEILEIVENLLLIHLIMEMSLNVLIIYDIFYHLDAMVFDY